MDLRKIGRRDGRSWKLPDVITKAVAVGRCGSLPLGKNMRGSRRPYRRQAGSHMKLGPVVNRWKPACRR